MTDTKIMKSVFTELLQFLGEYSEKVDSGSLSHDDYTEYQRLEARIINAYQRGYYHRQEYEVLTGAYYYIKEGARIVLGLD